MPSDPLFIDFLSSRLNVQATSLKEAVDLVVREVSAKTDAFSNNYNGYWLLLEKVYERAVAENDVQALRYVRFARSLVLLATGSAPDPEFDESDLTALAPLLAPELLARFRKQTQRQASLRESGPSYYPRIHALFDDLEDSLERFMFGPGYAPGFGIKKDTRILTMGSCFAENIARFLSSFGFPVSNFASPEEASPSTFPRMVESILNHPDATARDLIRNSPSLCVIFTAGVGEMVRLRNGEVVDASLFKENPARMRSVESVEVFPPEAIAASIQAGFAAIRELNPQANLVCTVSPVPLEASFDNSTGIMVRNAYSKAALMMGVQQACAKQKGIAYFPSYEIVKEWAALAGVQPFAADDGSPRHVSRNLVLIICLMFMKYFVGEKSYREILVQKTGNDKLSLLRKAVVQ